MPDHAQSGTLAANASTAVVLTGGGGFVEMISRDDTNDIWFTLDGSVPGIGQADSYYCGPRSVETVKYPANLTGPLTATLLSAGAASFTVQVV